MDYNINDFVKAIKQSLYDNFPNMEGEYPNNTGYMQTRSAKHPNTPMPVRDVALGINEIHYISNDIIYFEIGNDYAERKYPYYHILEEAPVIRKRGKGTKKSGGSQMEIALMSNRDFNIVSFNGKTFTKEYARNIRGKRNRVVDNSTRYIGGGEKINLKANSYENKHYRYIERTLDTNLPFIAETYNLKPMRVVDSGLAEEYVMDNYDIKDYDYDSVSQWVSQIINM